MCRSDVMEFVNRAFWPVTSAIRNVTFPVSIDLQCSEMNATDEDEFGELLGLPSNVGTTNLTHAPTNPQNSSSLPEPDDLYNEVNTISRVCIIPSFWWLVVRLKQQSTNQCFVREDRNSVQCVFRKRWKTKLIEFEYFHPLATWFRARSWASIPRSILQSIIKSYSSLDVDEAKIQPTVGLGGTLQQRPVTTETEFSIVVDPSGLDSRFASQSSGPMAGWVIPNQHSRRESHPQRPVQSTNFQSSTPGIRPPTGTNVGPLHPRSAPPTTNNSRASRSNSFFVNLHLFDFWVLDS